MTDKSTLCKFCRIDDSDWEFPEYKCLLMKYIFFKINSHIIFDCECKGNPEHCATLELCRGV